MIFGCWTQSAHYFKVAKFRIIWKENSKMTATFADRFMWDTHTFFSSVYVKGPRSLIIKISYFVHYSAQNNRGKDTFSENDQKAFCKRFVSLWSIRTGAQCLVAFISLTPLLLWLQWPQWQLSLLNVLLASSLPLPPRPPGDRGRDISACIPAWPGTGLHSLTPWYPVCYSGSRKRLTWTVPRRGHWPFPQGTGSSS